MLLKADRKYINGKIYTMKQEGDWKETLCVKDGKILAVGSLKDVAHIETEEVINLEGKTVLPGFIDCHQHTLEYSKTKAEVDLKNVTSKEELLEVLKSYAETAKPGAWIKGSGFDHEKFPDKKFPTKQELDGVTNKHPVIISRYCVHFHVANSLALKIAGIEGNENGLLRETAVKPVMALIPDLLPTDEDKKNAVYAAISEMNSYGITGIHPIGAGISNIKEYLNVYQDLEKEGRLNVRVYFCPDEYPVFGMKTGFGNEKIRYGFYKMFVDGSLGPRTAALSKPYSDMPENMGIMTNSPEEVKVLCQKAYDMGLQVGMHAIGDRGIEAAVDAMESCYLNHPKENVRFRLIHGMCMRPDLIQRIKKLPIIIDIQPSFTSNSNIWWSDDRLGPRRVKYAYAWKTLIKEGILLTGSSDCPVEHFSPMLGIYSVVHRQDRTGKPEGGWRPEQRVSVYEAICMYTKNAAYSSYEEDIKGTLEAGKLADYIILEQNPFEVTGLAMKDIAVLETCLSGKTVYKR